MPASKAGALAKVTYTVTVTMLFFISLLFSKEMEGRTTLATEYYRKFYKNFLIYVNEGKLPEIKNSKK